MNPMDGVVGAFKRYAEALKEFEKDAATAYNIGADVNGRLVDAALKGRPVDPADLASEMEMCLNAGKRAEVSRAEMNAAWKVIGEMIVEMKAMVDRRPRGPGVRR